MRQNWHDLVEVAAADAQGGMRDSSDGIQKGPDGPPRQQTAQDAQERQPGSKTKQRGASRSFGVLTGVLHALFVQMQDGSRDVLDLFKHVEQTAGIEVVLVALGVAGRPIVKIVALLLIDGGERGQSLHQFGLTRERDVVLLQLEIASIGGPARPVLLACLVLSASQGELKRGVDALHRFAELFHVQNTIIVLAEDGIDAAAEVRQHHHHRPAQQGEQGQHGQQRQHNPGAEGKYHDRGLTPASQRP